MLALLIFAATYFVLAAGSFPGLRVDRTGAAIIGAGLMVGLDVVSFEEAVRAVDYPTLVLLFGMMIVVANLRLSGFFRVVSAWAVRRAHGPLALLVAITLVSGVLSALFVNDTMCIVLTPLVVEVTAALRRNPVPYLLAVAMASNAGSVATITGNPQNMMIGSLSGIGYREFAGALAPVAAMSLVITFVWIAWMYRGEFFGAGRVEPERIRVRVRKPLLVKSLAASAAMVALFFAGWPVHKAAIFAAAVLLVTRRIKPERVYREIDFSLLALFAGLFIVVAGFEKTPLHERLAADIEGLKLDHIAVLSGVAAVLSNLVSNVPAVLLFRPVVAHLADPRLGWLTLAMASTLAGNLTLIGSVANLIVVENSRRTARISFWEYFRIGAPLAIITISAGIVWLMWRK
jgi:Na+/H+ antiporter NhaD/arsenite permease-like protein